MVRKALAEIPVILFLSFLGMVYSVLPRALSKAWGRAVGHLLYALKLREKVIRENLDRAFPGSDPETTAKKNHLFKESYLHLGELITEVLLILAPTGTMKRFVKKHGVMTGSEHLIAGLKSGRGVILLSSHVGNWETMAAGGNIPPDLEAIFDLMLVTKRVKPAFLFNAIEKKRATYAVKAAYEPRTLKDVLNQLKKGGAVGIVLDQYAGPPVGIRVPFFGVPVGTHSLPAMLAKRTGASVLPVLNYRLPDGTFRVDISAPLPWINDENAAEELGKNTAAYAALIETHVRAHPDQWLWMHRRFKGDLSPLRPGEWSEGRNR